MYRAVVIRFWRKGAIYYPVYDIVVTYKDKRYRGSFLERIGHYNPQAGERMFFINLRKLGFWLNRGAKIHSKVARHLPVEYKEQDGK